MKILDPNNLDLQSGDFNTVIQAVDAIRTVLDRYETIRILSHEIIEKIISLGNTDNSFLLSKIIDVISYITIQDDESLKNYLYLPFKQLLLNSISLSRNPSIVLDSLNALNDFTDEKIETLKLIDGEDLFNSALFVLSNLENSNNYYRLTKHEKEFFCISKNILNQIKHAAILLLSHCLCFFDAPEKIKNPSIQEIRQLFHSDFENDKIIASDMICKMSYFQADMTIHYFGNDVIQVIPILINSEKISHLSSFNLFISNVLGILNNFAFRSDDMAIFLPSSTPIFEIMPNDEWTPQMILNLIKLEETIFKRMKTCDQSEEMFQQALSNIKENAIKIYYFGIHFFEKSSFKIKNAVILMICGLLQIGDINIISSLLSLPDCSQNDDNRVSLFQAFSNFLCCNKIESLIEILKTVLMLCRLSPINGEIDVLHKIIEFDLITAFEEIIDELTQNADVGYMVDELRILLSPFIGNE